MGFSAQLLHVSESTKKEYPYGKIKIDAFYSFVFEICLFLILTVFNYFTKKTQNNIKYLNEHEEEIHRLVLLEK